jgi:protocatechuate 3,4-dioxygenase alpha subunit
VAVPRTPSQTVGPFFGLGLCGRPQHELVAPGAPGAVEVRGRVLDGEGDPLPDALVEIWQADERGRRRPGFGFGRCGTDAGGGFRFLTVKPGALDGPGGRQAPRVDLLVFARGLLKPVLTRMYFPDEEAANAADPLLSALPAEARRTLVARPAGDGLAFDVHLQGDAETAFFAV